MYIFYICISFSTCMELKKKTFFNLQHYLFNITSSSSTGQCFGPCARSSSWHCFVCGDKCGVQKGRFGRGACVFDQWKRIMKLISVNQQKLYNFRNLVLRLVLILFNLKCRKSHETNLLLCSVFLVLKVHKSSSTQAIFMWQFLFYNCLISYREGLGMSL